MIIRAIACVMMLLCCGTAAAAEIQHDIAFPEAIRGRWHALLAQPAATLGAAHWTDLIGGLIEVDATTFAIRGSDPAAAPLLQATCAAAPAPSPGTAGAACELETTITLAGCVSSGPGERRMAWRTSRLGILHVKIQTAVVEKGMYASGHYRGAADAIYLMLRREPVPGPVAAVARADATRIQGTWDVLGWLDDSALKKVIAADSAQVFQADRVDFLTSASGKKVPGIEGFYGSYRVQEPVDDQGAIDFQLEGAAGGGNGVMGFAPSLYRFHGEDLLYIAYCEQPNPRIPEAERPRCAHFDSDGGQNLAILVRRPPPP